MEIDVNLNIKAPELVESLNGLIQVLANANTLGESIADSKPKQTRTRHSKKAEEPKQEASTMATEKPKTESTPTTVPESKPKEDTTKLRDKLKAVAIEKARAGKNEDIKAAIKAAGSENLSGIPADKVSEVLEKISAL